jgi:hypothetical protein
VRAFKFLAEGGVGVFSRFSWPLPDGGPGDWVASEPATCQTGVHACRRPDLPYWVAPALYEIELEEPVAEASIKVVAGRGRLVHRIDEWNAETSREYSRRCIARGEELASASAETAAWAPGPEHAEAGPALTGFIAARIAERIGGVDAYIEERKRQSAWLVELLGLELNEPA